LGLRFNLNKPTPHAILAGIFVNLSTLLPLDCLQPGEWAEVCDISGEPAWVGRLAELGIRVGALIQMLCAGSPCLLQVGGGRLSLRGDPAMLVLVRPV
jgi:Fe2+ transport system protein FeoA